MYKLPRIPVSNFSKLYHVALPNHFTWGMYLFVVFVLLASKLSHVRVQSRFQIRTYIYMYIYICVAVRQVICACSIVQLGNEKLRSSVVRNVGGVKYQPLSKA